MRWWIFSFPIALFAAFATSSDVALLTPNASIDSLQSLQQIRTLIPERLWKQEFSLLIRRELFKKSLEEWKKKSGSKEVLGCSRFYFLRNAFSGESIPILNSYEEFLQSPFWRTPVYLFDLKQWEKR